MRARHMFAALLAVLLIGLPAPALADDSSMGGAGAAVKPIPSSDIRMAEETVQVIVFGRFAEYQVDFRFENSGEAQKIKLGFPFPLPYEEGGDYAQAAGFRAWQRDTELPVTYQEVTEKDGSRMAYWLHEAVFPRGSSMIRVRYYAAPDESVMGAGQGSAPPERFAGSRNLLGYYPYIMHTGAGWADTIGTSVIRYQLSNDALAWGVEQSIERTAKERAMTTQAPKDAAEVMRSYTQAEPRVYQWVFRNIEPTPEEGRFPPSAYDIGLAFYKPMEGDGAPPAWFPVANVKATSELKLDGYEYTAVLASDGYPSTAWAESAKGSGTGQSLTMTFPASRAVSEIRVLPGYAKTEALFRKYNRPKTLDVEFSDGTKTTLALADEPDVQRFPVNANAVWAKVTIGEVYRGTTRDETYLSEIEFGTRSPEMLPFETVLSKAGADETTGQTKKGSKTSVPLAAFKDVDITWIVIGVCGCALLFVIVVAVIIVVVVRRSRRNSQTSATLPPPPAESPSE